MNEQNEHIDENSKAAYIDWIRQDGPEPAAEVLDHVASCRSCKNEILELSEILDAVDADPVEQGERSSIWILIGKTAAVLGAVLLVSLIIQFLRPKDPDLNIASKGVDTLIGPEYKAGKPDTLGVKDSLERSAPNTVTLPDTLIYAANFSPNLGLEALVKARFRSRPQSGDSLIDPHLSGFRGDSIKMSFPPMESDQLQLILVKNSGEIVQQHPLISGKVEFVLNGEPGLYYWKLVSSEELLRVGKIWLYSR